MKPITKSRNRREGGYLGRYISVYDDAETPWRRHHRKGASHWKTLRKIRGAA